MTSHSHSLCQFGLPSEKCFEMGCQRYYQRLCALFSLAENRWEANLEEYPEVNQKQDPWFLVREWALFEINRFHILHPDGPIFSYDDQGNPQLLHDNRVLSVCVWCQKPISVSFLPLEESNRVITQSVCTDCFRVLLQHGRAV